jgi:hypothetical protein
MVACMLPTVAIAVLSAASGTLKENGIRIGLISLFTAVFAIGLMLLTETGTSRVQIFTGTAA